MGLVESIKDMYYAGEEKWYNFLDNVSEHIPVYRVIDAVDSVVPSFLLFLVLVLVIILALGAMLLATVTTSYSAQFTILAPEGKTTIFDSQVVLTISENGTVIQTLKPRTDADGRVYLSDLKYGQEIGVDINLLRGTYHGSFTVDKPFIDETITLQSRIDFSPATHLILVKDALGMNVRDSVPLSFYCSNSTVKPVPEQGTTVNSSISVTEPVNCAGLHAKVTSNKYQQKEYLVTGTSYTLQLVPYEPPTVAFTVNVRTADGVPINDASLSVTASGDNIYSDKTLNASQVVLNVVPGVYTVAVSDPSGKYAVVSKTVTVNAATTIVMQVTKAIRAHITANIRDVSTNAAISGGLVQLKDAQGNTLAQLTTDTSGVAVFGVTDVADYQVSAKKLGDVNGGYFSKTITLTAVASDVNVTLQLERITTANAGKTTVQVIDQDNIPVSNAKVYLKYQENDSIVELNNNNNWAMTDVNGFATFLAGKVTGGVYAYAIKYPFTGASTPKVIAVDSENNFKVVMQIGNATIQLNLTEENGTPIDGTARIVSMTTDGQDLSGLISIEQGKATRQIKAGQQVYVAIQSDTYENYVSEPIMLFPSKTYTLNVQMKKQITDPRIVFVNVYNTDDQVVRTMKAGKTYYAKFVMEASERSEATMLFRVGKEELLENDFLQIDKVESVGLTNETRGTSYSPTRGYSYDSDNITDGYAKWITVGWDDLERGQRVVKAYFIVKKNAPANQELQFFWRANFDGTKDPTTTNTGNDLYDDTRASNVYFVGEEAACQEAFCVTNESLYWTSEDLYINAPFEVKQAQRYTYKYQIYNNSDTDYGTSIKKIYLGLQALGEDNPSVKIVGYKIKDASREYSGSAFTKIDNLEIASFNRNSTIDVELPLEGNAVGATGLDTTLKADGTIIYTREATFSVPTEKPLLVTITPAFLPTLVDTLMTITVNDDKGEPVNEADVKVFAKEPGFDEYLIDTGTTNRLGSAMVHSGAHFPNTKVIVEVTKEEYARTRLQTTVSEDVLAIAPEEISAELNTVSQREVTKVATAGNQTTHKLVIREVKLDSDLSGVVNQDAMKAYLQTLIGTEFPAGEETEINLLKVRLSNAITQDNFIEPVSLKANIIISVEIVDTQTIYDKTVPLTVSVSSEANVDSACIVLSNATQSKTTQQGQVQFNFDVLNACSSNGTDVGLDSLNVAFSGELKGAAELSLVSPTSGQAGRTALDGANRKVYDKVKPGEKLVGTVTYTPSVEAVGQTINLPITITGKFQGKTIQTNPAQLNFTVNVLNLKDCMTISSDAAPVAFDAKTSVTVDASACLGQPIEVALCKNDAGCSGGAEGKVTLTKTTLNLKGNSETVDVYNPTLPGSYGVTVYARVKGKSSYNYIGEVPVSFRESTDKFFELSKYELSLVGNGSEDIVLLKNKMLTQQVKVKADECIWGKKDAKFGFQDYFMVASVAMMGATLGNMIGSGIPRGSDASPESAVNEVATTTTETQSGTAQTPEQANKIKADQLTAENTSLQNELSIAAANADTAKVTQIQNQITANNQELATLNSITNIATGLSLAEPDSTMYIYQNKTTGALFSQPQPNPTGTSNYIGAATIHDDGSVSFNNVTITTKTFVPVNDQANGVSSAANYIVNYADTISPVGQTLNNWFGPSAPKAPTTSPSISGTSTTYPTTPQSTGWNVDSTAVVNETTAAPAPPGLDLTYKVASLSALPLIPETGFLLPTFLSRVPQNNFVHSSPMETAFFAGVQSGTTVGTYGGVGTLIGAISFGILGYMLAEDALYKCDEHFDVVPFPDFVIFLEGDSISVTSPDGSVSEKREIPSDAGDLSFTLDGISSSWDFSNADYSTVENVAVKFSNSGLNDPQARYGTLTINATEHIDGKIPVMDTTGVTTVGTSSENDFDVWCKNDSFGNYWIGDTKEQGLCSGVSEKTYSQKYHMRVISADPQDEEAYIKKASSCYNGVLTGSTGPDAVPKVKLNWDWDKVSINACDYINSSYAYCDQTQAMITTVKKLALLEDFLKQNQGPACPADPLAQQAIDTTTQMNTVTQTVANGFIGPDDATVLVDNDHVTVTVKVDNKTGAPATTYYTYSVKGEGEPVTDMQQKTFATGITEEVIEFDVPKFDGLYFFTIVFNGPQGTRTALTRAFENLAYATTTDGNCWLPKTTRPIGGIPGITYYYSDAPSVSWTSAIKNGNDLYNYIDFGTYLVRDSYSDDFLNDFKNYYLTNFTEKMSSSERDILNYLNTSNFKVDKRFSGDTQFDAGLYDTWLYIDFGDSLSIIDSNATIEVSNLLVNAPQTSYPFYFIPFDGTLGLQGGRQGYGASYKNNTEGVDNELQITPEGTLNKVTTFTGVGDNGVVTLETKKGAAFVTVNSTLGTRGQLASVNYDGATAQMQFTPNYATPLIVKKVLDGPSGQLAYNINENQNPVNTGGNLNYWTGAAKSKDFFGSNAIDVYNNSPDFRLESGDAYGFSWTDATRDGTMYLKTTVFSPIDKSYVVESKDSGTTFWTPNGDFVPTQTLVGINGMEHNSQVQASSFDNLQQLFDMVSAGSVCTTNDGTSMTFWWNPTVIDNTPGTLGSLANEELALVGQ